MLSLRPLPGRWRLSAGLVIAVAINLLLIAAWAWSSGGQTTTVQIEAIGSSYRVFVDGERVHPPPDDLRSSLEVDAPEQGSIALRLSPPVPSLPEPQGIDSVVVRSPRGDELFRDEFHSLDHDVWEVVLGGFETRGGLLVATQQAIPNVLVLRGPGWSDYEVRVTYRNVVSAGVEVRHQAEGGVSYSFPNYLSAFNSNGELTANEGDDMVRTRKAGILRSITAMIVGAYPLWLLLLAVGIIVALLAGLAETSIRRRVKLPAPRHLRSWQGTARGLAPFAWLSLVLVVAVGVFGLTLHIINEYYARIPHLPDEASYMFQAKIFAAGKVTVDVPPASDFFELWVPTWLYERDGRWASLYPLGQPLILASGALVQAMWLVPPLVGASNVVLIYLAGRRMFDARVGAVAAILLAASPFFLMQSSNFMSHNTWAFYTLASLVFLLRRDRPLVYGLLSGLFFGLALNTRTLESAMLIPPFAAVLAAYLVPRKGRIEGLRFLAAFLAGGALAALAMLGYNASITGDPLSAPYTRDGGADAVLGYHDGFTFKAALGNQQGLLAGLLLLLHVWPAWVGLGFVLLPFVLGTRNRWDYFLLVCSLCVIAIYLLYRYHSFYEGPRYWYQAVPFLVLLTARGADQAARLIGDAVTLLRGRLLGDARPARWAGGVLVFGFVAALVINGTGGWLFGWNRAWHEADVMHAQHNLEAVRNIWGLDDRLQRLAREMELGNALVLVPEISNEGVPLYLTVALNNSLNFNGDIVWARYIEGRNHEVIDAFPGRRVYIADYYAGEIRPFPGVTNPQGR